MKRQLKRRKKAPYERIEPIPSPNRPDVGFAQAGSRLISRPVMNGLESARHPPKVPTSTRNTPALQSTNIASRSSDLRETKSTALPPLWPSTIRDRPSQILARLSSASRSSPGRPSSSSITTVSTPRTRIVKPLRSPDVETKRKAEHGKPHDTPMSSVRPLPSRVYSARWIGTSPPKFGRATSLNRASRSRVDASSSTSEATSLAPAFLSTTSHLSSSQRLRK